LVTDSKSRDTGNFGHRFKIQSENGRSREKINIYMAAQSQSLVQVLRKQIDQSQYSNVVV
jgi:hypothetical protein